MAKSNMRYTVRVLLYEIEPLIWRTLSVPDSITFAKFHEILQKAMGWENKELHEFRYGKGKNLIDVIATPHDDIIVGGKFDDESKLTLNTFLGRKRLPTRMLYRYDFAEDWVHEITFEAKEEDSDEGVILIDGARACPPEDCGGAYGYKDALEGNVEWMNDSYDPEAFDPKVMNF